MAVNGDLGMLYYSDFWREDSQIVEYSCSGNTESSEGAAEATCPGQPRKYHPESCRESAVAPSAGRSMPATTDNQRLERALDWR